MAEKKKFKSVEEILNHYREYHHEKGKKFKERIKKFEEFNDPDNIHIQQFAHHAHYVVFGKPSDTKNFPGAYNEAYKVLDKHLKEDDDVLDEEDKLAEILETYTDTFLKKVMGKGFKDTVAHFEEVTKEQNKDKDEGELQKILKKELRELKGQLMSKYYSEDGKTGKNILTEEYIKSLKGKKKVDLIDKLKSIGEMSTKLYVSNLVNKATEGLISEDDRLDIAKYLTPIFKERGWQHKKPHITRNADEQANHYSQLLGGSGDELKKAGYKPLKVEEKKEKS